MDRKYRWSVYAVIVTASMIYALVNVLASHREQSQVSVETLVFLCLLLAIGIRLRESVRRAQPQTQVAWVKPESSGIGVIVTTGVALICSIAASSTSIPRVQAAVADARLERANLSIERAATQQPPEEVDIALRNRFKTIQSITDLSYRYHIPVDTKSLTKTEDVIRASLRRPGISDETKQAGLITSAKLVGLVALGKTEAQTLGASEVTANTGIRVGYFINSTLELNQKNLRLLGVPHAPLTFGDDGRVLINHSTIIFGGLDLRARRPFQEVLFLDSSLRLLFATVQSRTRSNARRRLVGGRPLQAFDHPSTRRRIFACERKF